MGRPLPTRLGFWGAPPAVLAGSGAEYRPKTILIYIMAVSQRLIVAFCIHFLAAQAYRYKLKSEHPINGVQTKTLPGGVQCEAMGHTPHIHTVQVKQRPALSYSDDFTLGSGCRPCGMKPKKRGQQVVTREHRKFPAFPLAVGGKPETVRIL